MSVVDGLASANFTDPHNQRIIYLAVGGLVLLAVIVAVGTVVWWRSTRAEHPALAPLEVMSTRKFEKGDYTDRKRVLDEVRPPGYSLAAEQEVVDLHAAAAAPLPDPNELADPDHPMAAEGTVATSVDETAATSVDETAATSVDETGATEAPAEAVSDEVASDEPVVAAVEEPVVEGEPDAVESVPSAE